MSTGTSIATPETLRSAPGFVRFLSVAVSRRRFAIPLDRVIGVAESTKITPLPFSPPPFEGLVVAMGQVVPQIGLAPLLGLPSSEGGVVVLISDLGGSVGLRVEQVHTILQVDPEHVLLASPEQRAAEPMIIGRFGEGPTACGVLDLDHLTSDTSTMTATESGAVLLATEAVARTVDDDDTTEEHAEPYLMIGVSREVYAVKVDHLVELLELSSLRSVPHAPKWIAGMIDLRGDPILGLSLSELLGRPPGEADKLGMMVALPAGKIAFVAEHSFGIERYLADQIHALREPVGGVASYLVKPDESIVAIIDPETLVRQVADELPAWVPAAHAAEPASVPAQPMEFHQYLTLRVGREFLAVPLDRIQRLQANVRFTPIPDPGAGFHGLVDVGDAVVPVIDLRRILAEGTEPPVSDTPPPCLLTMMEGGLAGIIVTQVLRIETIPESQISPAEDAPNLPVTQILHVQGRLMSVISLDRLLPPL